MFAGTQLLINLFDEPKTERKCRIVDLRFGNVKAKAKLLRIHYQE